MGNIPELPDDLLINVFSQSLLYSSLFNPALSLGHVSAWSRALRHRKSVILVCKQWAACATPFLYRRIVIRRYGQLGDLVRTLDHIDCEVLASYVMELTISESCYVYGTNADLFVKDLKRLCHLCPRLTLLRISPHQRTPIPDSLLISSTSITKLALGTVFDSEEKTRILMGVCEKLVSLSLELADDVAATALNFPQLRELSITFKDWNRNFNLVVPTTWTLPSLESVSIHGQSHDLLSYPSVIEFIQKHGRTLLHLSLTRACHSPTSLLGPSLFLKFCPNLVHLATDFIPQIHGSRKKSGNVFPSIRILDFFSPTCEERRHDELKVLYYSSLSKHLACFPSLEVVTLCYLTVENFFCLPLPYHAGPVASVFKEAWNWVRPGLQLRTSYWFRQIEGIPSPDYRDSDIIVYTISPHAQNDEDYDWGMGEESLEEYIETPPSSTEGSESPVETETSYNSDISQGELDDIQRGRMG